RQQRMRTQVCARLSLRKAMRTLFCAEYLIRISHEMKSASERFTIDHDFDPVAFPNLADRSASKRLGRYMPDAGSGGDATEARIGQYGNVLAVGKLLERRSDLIDLLHARACGSAANKDNHIAVRDLTALDGLDRRCLRDENSGWTKMPVDIVLVDERRIDRGTLDDRALRREIAHRKADGRSKPSGPDATWRHDHIAGIDAVLLLQEPAQFETPWTVLPPIETRPERFSGNGLRGRVEESGHPQVQHHLGYA